MSQECPELCTNCLREYGEGCELRSLQNHVGVKSQTVAMLQVSVVRITMC